MNAIYGFIFLVSFFSLSMCMNYSTKKSLIPLSQVYEIDNININVACEQAEAKKEIIISKLSNLHNRLNAHVLNINVEEELDLIHQYIKRFCISHPFSINLLYQNKNFKLLSHPDKYKEFETEYSKFFSNNQLVFDSTLEKIIQKEREAFTFNNFNIKLKKHFSNLILTTQEIKQQITSTIIGNAQYIFFDECNRLLFLKGRSCGIALAKKPYQNENKNNAECIQSITKEYVRKIIRMQKEVENHSSKEDIQKAIDMLQEDLK